MWFLFALLSGLFAAILAILVKLYLKNLNPLFITFFFSVIAVLFLLSLDIATKKINCKMITLLSHKEWIALIIAALLNVSAFTFYITALKTGKTCGVIALDRLGIIFIVFFSAIFLQESLKFTSIFGALLMIIGVLFVTY